MYPKAHTVADKSFRHYHFLNTWEMLRSEDPQDFVEFTGALWALIFNLTYINGSNTAHSSDRASFRNTLATCVEDGQLSWAARTLLRRHKPKLYCVRNSPTEYLALAQLISAMYNLMQIGHVPNISDHATQLWWTANAQISVSPMMDPELITWRDVDHSIRQNGEDQVALAHLFTTLLAEHIYQLPQFLKPRSYMANYNRAQDWIRKWLRSHNIPSHFIQLVTWGATRLGHGQEELNYQTHSGNGPIFAGDPNELTLL
jgi:hypothetical protein